MKTEKTELESMYETYLSRVDNIVELYVSYSGDEDTAVIYRAYETARQAHSKQFRATGEPYIVHPLAVTEILSELHVDKETLVAALLHDTVEDTDLTLEDISEAFGDHVAMLVDGVTKLGKINYSSKEEAQAQNFRKMFLAMAKDIRVVLIKLADRLHNMRTMKYKKPDRQKEISRETLEIYAPLAHRLGIYKIKWELEDLCLRYIDPEGYYDLVAAIAHNRADREAFLEKIVVSLNNRIAEMHIKAEIEARPKHFYSIYKKMKAQNKTIDEIYDLLACRIIVPTVGDCYAVLGMVHEMYNPLPGRFKDYIAMPKNNGYQSLHTTVIGPQAVPFEVQIRTQEMHRVAEYGIAAHWRYKEGVSSKQDAVEVKLTWLRQLLEWSSDMSEATDYLDSLKEGLIEDEVFVFTPAGDVVSLPAGSIPIDFAYHIHSEVGHRTTGAKVNGHMVPLDYPLQNGDIVEIITSDNLKGPSRDWMSMVKATTTKNKIRAWFKKSMRSENVARGKEILESRIKKEGFGPDLLRKEYIQETLDRYTFKDLDDLYASLGYGGVSINRVFPRLRDSYIRGISPEARQDLGYYVSEHGNIVKLPENRLSEDDLLKADHGNILHDNNNRKRKLGQHGIQVRGMSNCLVNLAKCCNPLPGDDIVGFITRGKGVTVHRTDCHNIKSIEKLAANSSKDAERASRLIEVSWGDERDDSKFEVMLTIHARDRKKLLADVTGTISEEQIPIITGRMYSGGPANARLQMLIEVPDQASLERLCQRIQQIEGVIGIERGA
ncbi:MAG: bifunctional (p)ppGpp synthetase/guanosine-3',5'-bis(diphosphate) 3'-pyrophosphohydrolase [Eubacteriales bacterium]|nr:bifunctional (p)ppGpp synthetase/guanosine-3',5'-bis(diphosphate) 3'-pyrophosphohydrolase [Clostridiales bacterium]MDY5835574.1 bifunctional (p)ppGpp synthetase/guanosine-3',5'-bis(diphosphate) 3'-pyrophosphohydrolase [Eubacteriales bacterium]